MKKHTRMLCALILCAILGGCGAAETLQPTPTSTPTATTEPTVTNTPAPTLTPTPTYPAFPGEEIRFLYVSGGEIRHFDLQSGTSQVIDVQSVGNIAGAALSPDSQWLGFLDEEGFKLAQSPFTATPILLSTRLGPDVFFHMVFSSDSSLLAYSDAMGLWSYRLATQSTDLLAVNFLEDYAQFFRNYIPEEFSLDGNWLRVEVGHYEEIIHAAIHIQGSDPYEIPRCSFSYDWLAGSFSAVTAVSASGYYGCGMTDGIYRVSRVDGEMTEQRIYHYDVPDDPYERFYDDVQLSPDEQRILFTQTAYPDFDTREERLMLIQVDGSHAQELERTGDEIQSPVWSEDGSQLIYAQQSANGATRIILLDLATLEKTEIYARNVQEPKSSSLQEINISVLPGTDWILLRSGYLPQRLILVNTATGASLELTGTEADPEIQFVGVEE